MVRISDILKQKGQFPEPEKPAKDKEKEKPFKEEPLTSVPKPEEKPADTIQLSKAMAKEEAAAEEEMQVVKAMHQMQINPEESQRIYDQALKAIRDILSKAQSDSPLDLREGREIVKEIVDRICMGDKELLALTANHPEEDYLPKHSVNISILAADVGLALGYNKSKLNELALGALLADVGMVKVMNIVKQPHRLNAQEFQEVKKHPTYGSDILSRIKDIEEGILYIVKQEHERINGTGYPQGLKDDLIHEYAKIVAVVDVYEALTHPRPHRKAISPHEAIKELLGTNSSGLFKPLILKILINRIGLYPIGSWVELNTGEIAKVVSSNGDSPLRPKINVVFSSEKEKLDQLKSIDLFQHTNIFIKRSINPQELNLKLE